MRPDTARNRIAMAIKRGALVRPTTCELCGCDIVRKSELYAKYGLKHRPILHGHHWNGYDDPLSVWWICPSCNHVLSGKHDGTITKEYAKSVLIRKYNPQIDEDTLKIFYGKAGELDSEFFHRMLGS